MRGPKDPGESPECEGSLPVPGGIKSQEPDDSSFDEMKDEYDIRGGVRGKYYDRYQAGTNLVRISPLIPLYVEFLGG